MIKYRWFVKYLIMRARFSLMVRYSREMYIQTLKYFLSLSFFKLIAVIFHSGLTLYVYLYTVICISYRIMQLKLGTGN